MRIMVPRIVTWAVVSGNWGDRETNTIMAP